MAPEFTHLDPLGRARMVDVSAKDPSHRRAIARCRVNMESETASKIASGAISSMISRYHSTGSGATLRAPSQYR